ncbi:hypothetical protein ACP70R_029127 [Stipagrostis hirtigluma subsp. patula]
MDAAGNAAAASPEAPPSQRDPDRPAARAPEMERRFLPVDSPQAWKTTTRGAPRRAFINFLGVEEEEEEEEEEEMCEDEALPAGWYFVALMPAAATTALDEPGAHWLDLFALLPAGATAAAPTADQDTDDASLQMRLGSRHFAAPDAAALEGEEEPSTTSSTSELLRVPVDPSVDGDDDGGREAHGHCAGARCAWCLDAGSDDSGDDELEAKIDLSGVLDLNQPYTAPADERLVDDDKAPAFRRPLIAFL